jgi:methyl-accepting chemotaxis protein
MTELTAQTQAIGAIIAAVDQIATQSNLLSVNAAIEAARAGEKGKGFAVVADEVRYLSDQSRDATRQVRGILGDIQKATSAAVMTTEQTAGAVETGATQATRAGESIVGLEARVAEAAEVAGEIAASSHEQALGMEHVATAMDRIKASTRDNLREAQRLEGAARRLHTLGQQLKELAERHRA